MIYVVRRVLPQVALAFQADRAADAVGGGHVGLGGVVAGQCVLDGLGHGRDLGAGLVDVQGDPFGGGGKPAVLVVEL